MPKRRRTHGVDEGKEELDLLKKRRRTQFDAGEICQELYETIRNYKTDEGHLLCETFIRAPKRRSFADYYEVVTTPMDLLKIQQKLKTEEYTDVDQMTTDIELMVNNAKAYYKKNSQEYRNACELWELYIDSKNDIINSAMGELKHEEDQKDEDLCDDDHHDGSEEDNPYEELFTAVMTSTDNDGRSLSTMFQLLPSKVKYPEYYKIIHDPIDLKMIATKIQNNSYQTLTELERDLLLMAKNAKMFNEPGSQIYKDAAALRKVIINKKVEIDQRKSTPAKISERIRARKMASGQKWSAITAALQYESDLDDRASSITPYGTIIADAHVDESNEAQDDGNESGPEDADTNPQWQLYETVKNYQKSQGHLLSEPFLRLPNRRFYPDYYKEIKQPISLYKIRTKIKTGQYNSTMDVVDDMNLMFENARKYNRPDSKIFKDSDTDDDDDRTPKRKAKKGIFGCLLSDSKRKRSLENDISMKKRMKFLYKNLIDYTDENGRPLITMFMEKPSKKDYPDYYEIIANPIDMKTIESNIKSDKYLSEESLILDFKLMFNNCRQYNEEGSQIYRDAETLERILLEKIRDLSALTDIPRSSRIAGKRTIMELAREDLYVKKARNSHLRQKLKTMYDTVKDYTDNKNRKLSMIFMKLPSKSEYPDYYEVIKRPLDMDRIGSRMKSGQYENLEDMLSDFVLMFDNACKYNEPDSQIYKDALTLQRIALQTKLELSEDTQDGVPDVKALVQELLTNIFISVYNHQDEEGRCYSDSLVELSETDTSSDPQCPMKKPLSLDIIKRRLDKGRYKRLDSFQEDMFEVFEHARLVSRTDSQVFEDSIELQSYFIRLRDELCRYGEVLQSPALKYRENDLQTSVESLKAEKLPREQQEAELEPKQEKDDNTGTEFSTSDSLVFKGLTYYIGDFVYIEPREKGMDPHIMHIEKLWRDNMGEHWIYGCWFYRPNETFHLATRKFLQKELFKSDNHNSAPLSQVMGKCYVMFVKDYFKYRPEGFDDKDIYVCESRYSAKAKAFKKIKIWAFTPNNYVHIVAREESLNPIRVPSVFKDGVEKPKDDGSDIDDSDLNVIDKPRPNIICEVQNPEEGAVYYEQYSTPAGTFKLGDCCYVRTEHVKTLIGRIDRIWVNKEGNAFFHGPWFVTPQEVQHPPTRLFYKQEVFLSSIEDTNPLLSVIARCAVLDLKDYITRRITEIPEQDVYICESRYMEAERHIRKLPKGLKKFSLSQAVTDDEYYYFRKPINPQKELSPLMPKMNLETDNEDSNDQPPSCASKDEQVFATPSSSKKKTMKRLVTGYILFASEVRKSVVAANPDRSFGEISRMIGTEWRNLPAAQKSEYEDRAQKQNEETAAKEGFDSLPHSPASAHGDNSKCMEKGDNMIYECQWDGCDYQFEDHQDLIDHLITEPNGHVHQSYQNIKDNEYQCLWQNCTRIKKNIPPFPNMQRLVRHCKEVHLKAVAKYVLPDNRSRNFMPSRRSVAFNNSSTGPWHKTPDPIFISNPPRAQRLLHSTTYIKYIEGLQTDSKHISNWDGQLKATRENTTVNDISRLPVHWLANGAGNHGNVVNALWALRDFMLRDALNISKIL